MVVVRDEVLEVARWAEGIERVHECIAGRFRRPEPRRRALAGHHGQHPRPATERGEVRSLADNERSWAQYLDAEPDWPESFLGYTLAGVAAWVSD